MAKVTNIAVYSTSGQMVRELPIPENVLAVKIKPSLVHQVAVGYASNARSGNAHTKDRSEVAGGGKKPWKQKGTGRARHGSIRSPLWIGGGVTFGPRNERNYSKHIPAKLREMAKSMVVADHLISGQVKVVENFPEEHKTKSYAALLKVLSMPSGKRCLVLLTDKEKETSKYFRNIKGITVMAVRSFNAHDGLSFTNWLISETALSQIIKFCR